MQIGSIKLSGRIAPNPAIFGTETWLLCNGAFAAQAVYPALDAILGVTFGFAPPGFFVLPDYGAIAGVTNGRIPAGSTPGGAPGWATGQASGGDAHVHLWALATPDLGHGGFTPTPLATTFAPVLINGMAPFVVLAPNGHMHPPINPLDDHVLAGNPTDVGDSIPPVLAVGFFIRAL